MRSLSLLLITAIAVSAPALAQCSTLTVTGSINAGQTLTIDVSGAPANSLVLIAAGDAGSTTINFGMISLVLGVAQPFIVLPIGLSDASGHVGLSINIPANLPAGVIQDHTFTVQAITPSFTMGMPPSFSFCVSNTASLVSGNG